MGGVCCGSTNNYILDKGCVIKCSPTSTADCHRRNLVRVACIDNTELFQPTFHYDCPENQLRAVINRVAGIVPHPTSEGLKELRVTANDLGRKLSPTTADDINDMPNRYSGRKKQRYLDAVNDLTHTGVTKSDSFIKMFVKAERFDPHAKVNPDPRAIQFRGAKYCVSLASYLHPIEQQLYLFDRASCGVPRTRNVAKGLNSVTRASLLLDKLNHFERPLLISLDASRFDKHVSLELLQIEHMVYLMSNNDPYFRWLLKQQLNNKGFSNLGLSYKVRGRRMSGDMNTAVGNCIIMLIMMITFMRLHKVMKWDCIDDGDDIVVILEWCDIEKMSQLFKDTFLTFGMVMKVECYTEDPCKIVFCQSNIVEFRPDRWKFVRNWQAVVSKALCGIRHWEDVSYRKRVLKAIGLCELVLNLAVPVLQSFALSILRNCGDEQVNLHYAPEALRIRTERDLRAMGVKASNIEPWPIAPCARDAFARAFGLDENEQIALEKRFDSWTFEVNTTAVVLPEVDVVDWTIFQTRKEVYQ